MQPLIRITGLVAPLDRVNVDTDAIIPKQFLKSIRRSGFGPNLFDEWRYLDRGEPGQSSVGRPLNPGFVLNQTRYRGATILLTRENFGCGSSREHAPWALLDFGFQVILAESFADIFFNNCFKNGILPVVLPRDTVSDLMARVESQEGYLLTVDLEKQAIHGADGFAATFQVDPFRKFCLINGLDDIGLTLRHEAEILAFEAKRRVETPWVAL